MITLSRFSKGNMMIRAVTIVLLGMSCILFLSCKAKIDVKQKVIGSWFGEKSEPFIRSKISYTLSQDGSFRYKQENVHLPIKNTSLFEIEGQYIIEGDIIHFVNYHFLRQSHGKSILTKLIDDPLTSVKIAFDNEYNNLLFTEIEILKSVNTPNDGLFGTWETENWYAVYNPTRKQNLEGKQKKRYVFEQNSDKVTISYSYSFSFPHAQEDTSKYVYFYDHPLLRIGEQMGSGTTYRIDIQQGEMVWLNLKSPLRLERVD